MSDGNLINYDYYCTGRYKRYRNLVKYSYDEFNTKRISNSNKYTYT